jgi:large subunit ribosomal protein L25
MSDTILRATERTENPKKVRDAGFIPGVLNGPGTTSTSVKFEPLPLKKVIAEHGKNAKIWIELGNERIFGFIKDIQRHPVVGNILHIVVHLVSLEQEVKMRLPITYNGQEQLEHRLLHLQVYRSDIEVLGKPDRMPDVIAVNISEKEFGESITTIDFKLSPEIKILDPEHEIYAVIKSRQEVAQEEPKEAKPAV